MRATVPFDSGLAPFAVCRTVLSGDRSTPFAMRVTVLPGGAHFRLRSGLAPLTVLLHHFALHRLEENLF